MTKNSKKPEMLAVNVLIVNREEQLIFCVKRSEKDQYFPGMYAAPGGGINEGENFENAIKREFLEETGYELFNQTEVKLETTADMGKFILHVYVVEGEVGEQKSSTLDPDIAEVGWIPLTKFYSSLEEHHYPAPEIQKLREYLE